MFQSLFQRPSWPLSRASHDGNDKRSIPNWNELNLLGSVASVRSSKADEWADGHLFCVATSAVLEPY